MGQDGEEAAELVATIRNEHVVMKTWFMGDSPEAAALRGKYGSYPGLWKEVLNWPGWREARKAYLQQEQKRTSSSSSSSSMIPRKRRSRWGRTEDTNTTNGEAQQDQNKRRSRWGKDMPPPSVPRTAAAGAANPSFRPPLPLPGLALPGMPSNLNPEQRQQMETLQGRLRIINDKLKNLDSEAVRVDALPRGHRDRSPSPPPVYGADGKRKNTRAVRWRERYSAERQDLLEQLMNMNPATRKSGLFKRKRTKKIRIPVEQHPTYNFIGLIIGPRGKTQKELESKTGCKIAIRGRGSVKEGARGRRDGKMMEGDNEPLHVVITGDDQRSVDAATDMIEQMLVVIDDEKNVHKQQQLRELALLNGTLKEDEYCPICGEKGHRAFECPKRFTGAATGSKSTMMQVKCAICGDTSHPTRDCTQKGAADLANNKNSQEIDSDYMSFMAELDGKKKPTKGGATATGMPTPACIPVVGSKPSSTTPTTTAKTVPTTTTTTTSTVPSSHPAANPSSTTNQLQRPPPPPPPGGIPPPPGTGGNPQQQQQQHLPPPPVTPMASGGGPPPTLATTGPAQPNYGTDRSAYYGGYHQQQQRQQQHQPRQHQQQHHQSQSMKHHQGYPPQQQQQQQQAQYQQYGVQQQYPQGQQAGAVHAQYPNQPAPGDEVSGWDYQSYYGYGGDAGGAGGFNWWG